MLFAFLPLLAALCSAAAVAVVRAPVQGDTLASIQIDPALLPEPYFPLQSSHDKRADGETKIFGKITGTKSKDTSFKLEMPIRDGKLVSICQPFDTDKYGFIDQVAFDKDSSWDERKGDEYVCWFYEKPCETDEYTMVLSGGGKPNFIPPFSQVHPRGHNFEIKGYGCMYMSDAIKKQGEESRINAAIESRSTVSDEALELAVRAPIPIPNLPLRPLERRDDPKPSGSPTDEHKDYDYAFWGGFFTEKHGDEEFMIQTPSWDINWCVSINETGVIKDKKDGDKITKAHVDQDEKATTIDKICFFYEEPCDPGKGDAFYITGHKNKTDQEFPKDKSYKGFGCAWLKNVINGTLPLTD